MDERSKVISIALNEVGYLEKKSNSQLDDKTANAGSGVWRTIPWCFNSLTPEYMGGAYISSDGYISWQAGSGLTNFTKGNAIVEYTKSTD